MNDEYFSIFHKIEIFVFIILWLWFSQFQKKWSYYSAQQALKAFLWLMK